MTDLLALADLRTSSSVSLLEGRRHSQVDVSIFVSCFEAGDGPSLHRHPYPEVFVVEEGTAAFTSGSEQLVVAGGHVLVIPAETPHRFENVGTNPLRIVSIHPSGEVRQTDLC